MIASFYGVDAGASPVSWTVDAPAARAQITGGPWVLAQGDAAVPYAGFPAPNPGTNSFQPYYHAFVTGTPQVFVGFFDYRPYGYEEAIVAATSTDLGRTWTFKSKVADFAPELVDDAAAPSDVGEGHPFVATFNGTTYLYTLDRSAGFLDSAGLIVRAITPNDADPLNGAPALAQLGDRAPRRTSGLASPDGIFAVIPGQPNTVLYLEKILGASVDAGATDGGAPPDVTRLHLADTIDGITFTNDRPVTGIIESDQAAMVGPRGTLITYDDGHFGMFFSAGLAGEDSDAFHYVGYAESSDLLTWTVMNGIDNPLLSIDPATDPNQQSWYAGRVYAPNVVFGPDACKATMVFTGYATTSPKRSLSDNRQVGVVGLTRGCEPEDAGTDAGDRDSGALDAGVRDAAMDAGADGADAAANDAGSGGAGGGGGGCSSTPGSPLGGAAWIALGALGALHARRRRDGARTGTLK
jgi:MYXO-CTERM domain-containing protein